MNAPANATNPSLPLAGVPLPIRYFDCVLVLAFLPFALLAGLPALGSVGGVAAWLVQRALGVAIDRHAAGQADYKRAVGLSFAARMLCPLLVALTIVVLGQLGERKDGLTAALIALVAFTVYMILSFIFRPQRHST